jgi:hypothetical protein
MGFNFSAIVDKAVASLHVIGSIVEAVPKAQPNFLWLNGSPKAATH